MSAGGGRPNVKGVNHQMWAAMSLFLQHVGRTDFKYIGFEADKLEDFHLVFEDGRKIICECKSYKIGFSQIKTILDKVIAHNQLNKEDEVLVICEEADKSLKNFVERLPFYDAESIKKITEEKKLSIEQLKILPQVRFWEITQEFSIKTAELLISPLLNVWVPTHRISEIVRDLLEKEVYEGSQQGESLSRDRFLKMLEEKKRIIFDDAGYEKDKLEKEKELNQLINDLKNPRSPRWSNNSLSILSDNPDLHYWTLTKLEHEKSLNLKDWDRLWRMSLQGAYVFEVFKIFKKAENISIPENQDYFIQFFPEIIEKNSNFLRDDFIRTDIVNICKVIVDCSRKYDEVVFSIIQKLFEPSISKYFYSEHRDNNKHEWEEISDLLLNLYKKTESKELKDQILFYVLERFNIVEDEWTYWHFTPPAIFKIVFLHYEDKPEKGILELTEILVKQFNAFYKQFGKGLEFRGWEHMGGGISQSGNSFTIHDRHFIYAILRPLVQKLWDDDKEIAWNFIVKNLVTRSVESIDAKKPDFLNRTIIPFLFSEYKNGKHSKEAFVILTDFIKIRKGIPWKVDIIFQELKGDFSEDEKWDLVEISLDNYEGLPVNIFVEQIIADLASHGKKEALEIIAKWVLNPEYNRRQIVGSFSVMDNISKLLDNPDIFNEAVKIYKNYISNKDFIEKDNDWETWDVAKILGKIIIKNPDMGIEILQEINSSHNITLNQQTLITSSINDLSQGNKELLLRVYKNFLSPLLNSLENDISQIESRITNRHSRALIVQFADKLAEAHYFEEALSIVKIFISDSDPILTNYPDDTDGTFNYHQKVIEGDDNPTINTVRGFCAWVLQKFGTLYGRDYISQAISLVKKLTKDDNSYVRIQACVPLLELAKNRNTVLPDNPKERFISIKSAQEIEDIAFAMLEDPKNHKLPAVMKHLAMVFSYIRTIDQEKAYKVLQIFLKDEYPEKKKERGRESYLADVIGEAAPLYIFFAEYRKAGFPNWPKEWGDLSKFDDKPFKELLLKLCVDQDVAIKAIFAWQFARLPEELRNTPKFTETIELSASYFNAMAKQYDHETFDDIYRFVEDYLDVDYETSINLWKKCITTEAKYFKSNFSEKNFMEMYWWPFFYNGKILMKIAEKEGSEEFLKWLRVLIDYPVNLLIANDLDLAIEYLTTQPYAEGIDKIFTRLIERNSKYLEYKQRWQANIKSK